MRPGRSQELYMGHQLHSMMLYTQLDAVYLEGLRYKKLPILKVFGVVDANTKVLRLIVDSHRAGRAVVQELDLR